MPTTLSITFHGMCFFARREDRQTDVLCHPEGGAHRTVLTVPAKFVEIGANQWQPAFVGHDATGEEIGVWDLTGESLELGVGTDDRRWQEGVRGFRMRDFHPEARTVDDARANEILFGGGARGALIALTGGVFRFTTPPSIRVRVSHKGEPRPPADYASAVSWEGRLDEPKTGAIRLPTNRQGEELKLRRLPRISMRVTNVATIAAPMGLEHFERYYDFVENVSEQDRIRLAAANLDVDVWDCVPPTDD